MIVILEIGGDVDLSAFSGYLWQRGIRHRITERGGRQLVWVEDEEAGREVAALYQQQRDDQLLAPTLREGADAALLRPEWFAAARRLLATLPVSVTLVLVCFAFFPLTLGYEENRFSEWLHWFTFTDFYTRRQFAFFASLEATLRDLELWRLWTPMFIHFGVMHLVFNLVMLWVCAQRIESRQGHGALALVTAASALVSNLSQYWMSGPGLFGGMSGVVYGYLGYCFMWSRLAPRRSFGLPVGIYVFMLIWLVLGFSGVFDLLLAGAMANGAHLGGLVAGLALGFGAARLARRA